MDDAMHRRRLTLDAGYTTELRDDGTGPVVVFVHPTPLDRRVWDGVMDRLGGHRVISYDVRGHGTAHRAPMPSFYGTYADDLARLLDLCDVERAHVVGHGFGGEIAQALALRHPGRLESLTLLGTRADPLPFLAHTADHVLRHPEAARAATLARWFPAEQLAGDGDVVRYARACLQHTEPRAFATALHAFSSFDIRDRLDEIHVPTRVIALDRDVMVLTADAEDLAQRLPHGELSVAHDAGPLLPLDDPDRFVALLDHLGAARSPTAA